MKPPIFISGGKRLNFDREDDYEPGTFYDDFSGYGKDTGCHPSGSWKELCAFATLIVNHPAYVAPSEPGDYYPPRIVDEPVTPAKTEEER